MERRKSLRRSACVCGFILILAGVAAAISISPARNETGGGAQESMPLAGMEWLAQTPPQGAGGVGLRTPRAVVGVVLPDDIPPGDTISGTGVAAPESRKDAAVLVGVVVEDPAGK